MRSYVAFNEEFSGDFGFWRHLVLPQAAYSPDLPPSVYYLFAWMRYAFAEQRFTSYENSLMIGPTEKCNNFFGVESTNNQRDRKNV